MKLSHILAASAVMLSMSGSVLAYPQTKTDTSISGHVTDAKTGEHPPFITIMLKGTNIGTQTSASGHYTIRNLPAGTFEIVAASLGYKDSSKILELRNGESYELNFRLEEGSLEIDQVVLSATRNHSSRKEAPSLVNVVDNSIFARTVSPTLADGLVF